MWSSLANGRLPDALHDGVIFEMLQEAKGFVGRGRRECHHFRSHRPLEDLLPAPEARLPADEAARTVSRVAMW